MVIELNDGNYSELVEHSDKAIFIDFYSPMCGPCQEVLAGLPHLENYFKEEVIIAKVDVTQNPKLAKKYQIQSVPFCVSIGAKDKMVKDYELGAASVERYIRMVKKAQGKGFFARLFS
jgi:thioredoxin-like negative regulator of GroEL